MTFTMQEFERFLRNDWQVLTACTGGLLLWLLSGAMASSIAETRVRSPWVHLILGLLLPVVYPILALFFGVSTVKQPKIKEAKERDVSHPDGPPPVELPAADVPIVAREIHAESIDEVTIFTPEYFKDMALDEYGNYRGPFLFKVHGIEQRADRIVECMPGVVVTESITPDGKSQRLRIPYDKVEGFEEL